MLIIIEIKQLFTCDQPIKWYFYQILNKHIHNTMSFGKKLSELRKSKGLSQEDLAFELGISQSSVSNYEGGTTLPDILILERVSAYFNTPVTELLSGEHNTFYNSNNAGGQNGYVVNNNIPEKLIEQYEATIAALREQIVLMKQLLDQKQ